jgi:hypothetical protein
MPLKEDAAAGAISATAIAGVRSRLGGRIKRVVPMTPQKKKPDAKTIKESSFSAYLKEFANDPTPVDVIGKLSQNAKQSDDLDGDGVATYGLETDDGAIVKVLVAREQAKDFEKALADALQDLGDSNTPQDVAELLFDLNDQFHIVDVVWPTIQEDEEEPIDPGMDPNADQMGDPNAMDPNAMDPNADPNAMDPNADPMGMGDDGMGDTGAGMDGVQSALDQIIDFLKSDAEARKAEADAKAAEAKAREAEAAGKAAEVKMAGEEEILNAEDYFKQKKDADKEANRLKMLAKYRQETSGGSDDQMASQADVGGSKSTDEDEEVTSKIRQSLLRILRGR